MLRTILFLAYFSFTMQLQQKQQSASSTPKPLILKALAPLAPLAPKMPLAPLAPKIIEPKPKSYIIVQSPIPRQEKQFAVVLKEDDIRRKMWDTGNAAAAATAAAAAARGRMAELAKLASRIPQGEADANKYNFQFPALCIFLTFAFCARRSIYKSIHTLLLKYNKSLEIQRNASHELYAIGVKEEVRHNLQLQHPQHPLIRSRTNLSKGDLSV